LPCCTTTQAGWNKRHKAKYTQQQHGVTKSAACRVGGLVTFCAHLDFRAKVQSRPFTIHTPYVIPGYTVDANNCIILVTTVNLALNWYRASVAFHNRGGPMFAIDHTYSMDGTQSPHLAFNVIGPRQSIHRIAFGVVSSESTNMTRYAFKCIRQHAEDVAEWYAQHSLTV
jgi:hypothetical protein